MRGMRWFYYLVAVVATVVSLWLWTFVLSQSRHAPAAPVAVETAGLLPVVSEVRPADPVRAELYRQLRDGRAVCLGGYYARQGEGGESVTILVNDAPISCP